MRVEDKNREEECSKTKIEKIKISAARKPSTKIKIKYVNIRRHERKRQVRLLKRKYMRLRKEGKKERKIERKKERKKQKKERKKRERKKDRQKERKKRERCHRIDSPMEPMKAADSCSSVKWSFFWNSSETKG